MIPAIFKPYTTDELLDRIQSLESDLNLTSMQLNQKSAGNQDLTNSSRVIWSSVNGAGVYSCEADWVKYAVENAPQELFNSYLKWREKEKFAP